ncbi:class II glutamine amidotransferase [Candidatus Pacearchaeota archaeon]|nr:class II glutamine amidotransferase [Candidatus Pacearchaeota archaeon]
MLIKMCGIAAIIPEKKVEGIGKKLVDMLIAQQIRGADSAGFAFYFSENEHYGIRVGHHVNEEEKVKELIRNLCSERRINEIKIDNLTTNSLEKYTTCFYRVEPEKNISEIINAINNYQGEAWLISYGKRLDIIKDIGLIGDITKKYNIEKLENIVFGIAHVRTATHTEVNSRNAHPFSTSAIPDIAVVHNGEISNYHKLKSRLENKGYKFFGSTDTEVIAVWIADRLNSGYSLENATREFVETADGPFTCVISIPNEVAFVKDRYATRPATAGYCREGYWAISTDLAGLHAVNATKNLDSLEPGGVRVFNTK